MASPCGGVSGAARRVARAEDAAAAAPFGGVEKNKWHVTCVTPAMGWRGQWSRAEAEAALEAEAETALEGVALGSGR